MATQPAQTCVARTLWQMKAQPKKTAAMTILVGTMLIMWGRILLSGDSSAPSAARATSMAIADTGRPRVDAPQLSRTAQALADWLSRPMPPAPRNLFTVKMEFFPQDGMAAPAPAAQTNTFWDELAKSLSVHADQEKARRILIENLRQRASKLELQSTVMSGSSPKALVNGTLVGEGDTLDGFRVVKIEARRIIVEREGVKLEILFRFGK